VNPVNIERAFTLLLYVLGAVILVALALAVLDRV
jgi:hypothetical protein